MRRYRNLSFCETFVKYIYDLCRSAKKIIAHMKKSYFLYIIENIIRNQFFFNYFSGIVRLGPVTGPLSQWLLLAAQKSPFSD